MSSEQEDKLEGEYKSYYDNGQTKTHEFYRNGKLEGRYKSWYDSGGIIEHKFYEDGNLEGKRQIWKPNGELWVQLFYRRGSQEGEERSYWVYPTYDYYREGKSVDNSFSPRKRNSFLRIRRRHRARLISLIDMLILDLARIVCE
jgi:antitoxin component YwqK of YwqJK toxin-antitoxin module